MVSSKVWIIFVGAVGGERCTWCTGVPRTIRAWENGRKVSDACSSRKAQAKRSSNGTAQERTSLLENQWRANQQTRIARPPREADGTVGERSSRVRSSSIKSNPF